MRHRGVSYENDHRGLCSRNRKLNGRRCPSADTAFFASCSLTAERACRWSIAAACGGLGQCPSAGAAFFASSGLTAKRARCWSIAAACTGADFVPFTLKAVIPMPPGTEIALQGVGIDRADTPLLSCGTARTEPVAFAVSDRSVFFASIPESCASVSVAIRVIAQARVVAEFNALLVKDADLGALVRDEREASSVYGWAQDPRGASHVGWRPIAKGAPIAAVVIVASIILCIVIRASHRYIKMLHAPTA